MTQCAWGFRQTRIKCLGSLTAQLVGCSTRLHLSRNIRIRMSRIAGFARDITTRPGGKIENTEKNRWTQQRHLVLAAPPLLCPLRKGISAHDDTSIDIWYMMTPAQLSWCHNTNVGVRSTLLTPTYIPRICWCDWNVGVIIWSNVCMSVSEINMLVYKISLLVCDALPRPARSACLRQLIVT